MSEEHHNEEHHEEHHDECHDKKHFNVGDKIKYHDKIGTVTRTSILGMKPCCAIQVDWDDGSMKSILHMKEIKHCVKV